MKTQVEEINRNIYDIKNKDDYDFKIKKGLTKEIINESRIVILKLILIKIYSKHK